MAAKKPTTQTMLFQPRAASDGIAAAYLAWRLSDRVKIADSGCWEWIGQSRRKGYGRIDLKNYPDWSESVALIHRVIYSLCVGQIPEGACVCHRCDNPPCCRPDHLFLGTNLDNIADKLNKGRQAKGEAVRANHDHLKGEVIVTALVTADQVMEMRRRDAAGESPASIAPDFGISTTQVQYIVTGKAWGHLPLLYSGDRTNRPCPKCSGVFPTRQGIFYRHVAECHGLLLGKE